MSNTMLDAIIEFEGFYDSIHEVIIHEQLNNLFTDFRGMERVSTPFMDAWEHVNFNAVRKEYVEMYAEMFSDLIEVRLEFVDATSTRDYTYTSDRINVKIALKDAKKIFAETDKEILNRLIKRKFTSCSGFISFYDNDLNDWPADLAEWDDVQIGVLLTAYAQQYEQENYFKDVGYDSLVFFENEMGDSDTIGNNISNMIYKHSDKHFKRLIRISEYLTHREDRKYR